MSGIVWKTAANGDWSGAQNWSTGTVPGAADNVTISTYGSYTVMVSVAEAANFLLLSASGAELQVNAVLDVAGLQVEYSTIAIGTGGQLAVAGGTFGPYGEVEIDGPGVLSTSGSIAIETGVYIGGGLDWENAGTLNFSQSLYIGDDAGGTAMLTNQAGGVLDFTAAYQYVRPVSVGDALTLVNAGTIGKNSDGGNSDITALLTNTGVIDSEDGVLEFDDGGMIGGTVTGAGVVAFYGGIARFAPGVVLNAAELLIDGAGTGVFAYDASVAGMLAVYDGTLGIASGVTLDAGAVSFGAVAELNGPGTLATSGTVTVNAELYLGGGLNWSNTGQILVSGVIYAGDAAGGTATLTNQDGGVIDLLSGNQYIEPYGTGDALILDNQGLIIETGNNRAYVNASVTNTGVLSAASGTLDFAGTVLSTGILQSEQGGVLEFSGGGDFTGTILGNGIVEFAGGVSTLSGTAAAAVDNLAVTGGTLLLAGSFTGVTGDFIQTGGTVLIGTGNTLALASALFGSYGGAEIDGPGTLLTTGTMALEENSLYLGGGVNWRNAASVNIGDNIYVGDASGVSATIVNQAAGQLDFTGEYQGLELNGTGANATLTNQGLITKSNAAGPSQIDALVLNSGLIDAAAGLLEFDGGGTFDGTLAGGGTVGFDGGTAVINADAVLSVAELAVLGGAVVFTGGLVTDDGVFSQTGGTVSIAQNSTLAVATALFGPYGGARIDGPGTFVTTGTLTTPEAALTLGGGLDWVNAGNADVSNNIYIGDASGNTASIDNLAGAELDFTGGYQNVDVNSGSLALSNEGTISKSGDDDPTTVGGTVTNTGLIISTEGVLEFTGTVSSTGTLEAEAGSTLEFSGGGVFAGTMQGAGTIAFGGGLSTLTGTSGAGLGNLQITAGTLVLAENFTGVNSTFGATGGTLVIGAGNTLSSNDVQSGPYGSGEIEGPGTLLTTGTTVLEASLYLGGGLNWLNSGTIEGTGDLYVEGGGASLTNLAGAVLALDGGYQDLLSESGSLTLLNQGELVKQDASGPDIVAAAVTNTGLILTQDGVLELNGPVENDGVMQADAGAALELKGDVTGGGSVTIAGGSLVEFGAADANAVSFTGIGTLELGAPADFTGTIYGITAGDEIVFDRDVTALSMAGAELEVTLSGGSSFALDIAGVNTAADFSASGSTLVAASLLQQTGPALAVASISTAPDAVAGQPVTLNWVDENLGAATASGPWTDDVYAVSDAAGDDPTLIGSIVVSGALAAGGSLAESLVVTLAPGAASPAYFMVQTDALDQVSGDATGPQRSLVSTATTLIAGESSGSYLSLYSATPGTLGNAGDVVLDISGAGFTAGEQVTLFAPGGAAYVASAVQWVSGDELTADFSLAGAEPGAYTLEVDDISRSAALRQTVEIGTVAPGQLSISLSLPASLAEGSAGVATLTYANTGGADIIAPLLDISSPQALLEEAGGSASSNIEFLAEGTVGPAGILLPGETVSVSFTYAAVDATSTDGLTIAVGTLAADTAIDWSTLEAALRPPGVDQADWNNIWTVFQENVGDTTDSLNAALAQEADELSQIGQPAGDMATLLQDEIFQASGALAGTYLATSSDITPSSSLLSLGLSRYYDATLLGRDDAGAFGDGWRSDYDVTATTDAGGDVYVQRPGGLDSFTLENGVYFNQSGDGASLSMVSGLLQLRDSSGNVEAFDTQGRLASITDGGGNVTQLSYGSNGVLQSVKNLATGETISFVSNAAGRITSATDSDGQAVTYSYDATGTLLLSATGPGGTTSYTYQSATGSVNDNALLSVTNTDGTQDDFTYDAEGRLATASGGGAVQSYNYAENEVTVSDASGDATSLLYNAAGDVTQVQDALGNVTQLSASSTGDILNVITADGESANYGYDSSGNVTLYSEPDGYHVRATYAPGTDLLTSFTDEDGNTTGFSYDSAGDLTAIDYADGSGTAYDYNTLGELTEKTDALGQITLYSYNSAGALTSENFSDGTSQSYSYNTAGDLVSATATDGGVTSYTYNVANELTSVTDENGRVESYSYNDQGQKTQRMEPDGTTTNYSYNTAGQLASLTDGSGAVLVSYGYNAAGQLVAAAMGNGASTSYSYDALGNVSEIETKAADGSITSLSIYAYDSQSRPVEVTSLDGTWHYTYNSSGELYSAVFDSTNADIPDQNLTYEYDAAGNRTATDFNGASTSYSSNDLNEYTSASGAVYAYDADGNLVSVTSGGQTTDYGYNAQNELVSETGPDGTTTYKYDALGNQISATTNGVETDYVIDPLAITTSATGPLSAIAQVYDAAGTATATYDYGDGLAAVTTGSGTDYFNADATGNITSVSGENGTLVASYGYTPFGTLIDSTGSLANPFQFSGLYGETTDANGLVDMRARYYSPTLGRFISEDPLGISAGPNVYSYANSAPTYEVDPTGYWYVNIGGSVAGNGQGFTFGFLAGSKGVYPYYGFGLATTGAAGAITFSPYNPETGTASQIQATAGPGLIGLSTAWTTQLELREVGLGFGVGSSKARGAGVFVTKTGFIPWSTVASFLSHIVNPVTLLISGIIPQPPSIGSGPTASLYPDPHLTTFDGLYYSFQTAGEFVLARDTNGGTFQVQARLSAPQGASTYSVITELGIQVGADRVTIDSTRADAVWVNGTAVTLTDGVYALAGGDIFQTNAGYEVALSTGEIVVADFSSGGTQLGPTTTSGGISTTVALGPLAQHNSVEGLLGNYNGNAANDLTLADGTVLPTDLSLSDLYGEYASAWRVTQDSSLLDYGTGQTTATFTDTNYPGAPITLDSFPTAAVQAALAVVEQAGITDPALQQAALYDYLVTGDPTLLTVEANLQQQGVTATTETNFTASSTPAEIGIMDVVTSQVEASTGATSISFEIYRSGDTSEAASATYSVIDPVSLDLGAGDFAGTLPSGLVTFAAGQTQQDITISLPGDIGTVASRILALELTAPSSLAVIAAFAQTEILNSAAVAGPAPEFSAELVNDPALLPNVSGTVWSFDLGILHDGDPAATIAIGNGTLAGADDLAGTINASGSGLAATVSSSFSGIEAGGIEDVAVIGAGTSATGIASETFVVTPYDINTTGYDAALPAETIILTGTINNDATAALANLAGGGSFIGTGADYTLDLGEILQGSTPAADTIAIANSATGPADLLSGSYLVSGDAVFTNTGLGDFYDLAAGTTQAAATISLDSSTVGSFSETIVLAPEDGNVTGYQAALAPETLVVSGDVAAVACFCAGTRIATKRGNIPVEHLRIGDLVKSMRGGFAPVKWIGHRAYDGRFIAGNHLALPIRIRRHALGFNVPSRDLYVSPDHAICEGGVLVYARRLINGVSITQLPAVERVTYYHVELDRHDVIFAENCPAESFINHEARQRFANAAEFSALYPEVLPAQQLCLPRVDSGFLLYRIHSRIARRAGAVNLAAMPHSTGPLRGHVDEWSATLLRGWVQDVTVAEMPVPLEILHEGRVIFMILANEFRPDLRAAGLGSGGHGFSLALPGLRGPILIRRAGDGALFWRGDVRRAA